MDVTTFEGELAQAGFLATGDRTVPPGTQVATHAHGFDLRALMPAGEITLGAGANPRSFGPGEGLAMPDGRGHEKRIGPQGLRFLIGRRRR